MILPSYKRTRDPVRAPDFNALTQAARAALNAYGHRGTSIRVTDSGISVAGHQASFNTEPGIFAYAKNCTGGNANVFMVMQLTDPLQLQSAPPTNYGEPLQPMERVYAQRVLEFQTVRDHCSGRFCVTAEHIPPGQMGRVWIGGACLAWIKTALSGWRASQYYGKPDRADTIKDDYYLRLSTIGAAQVLWLYHDMTAQPPSVVTTGLAIIRFDHRQTTPVGIYQVGNKENQGLAEVIELDASITVTKIAPGCIRINRT